MVKGFFGLVWLCVLGWAAVSLFNTHFNQGGAKLPDTKAEGGASASDSSKRGQHPEAGQMLDKLVAAYSRLRGRLSSPLNSGSDVSAILAACADAHQTKLELDRNIQIHLWAQDEMTLASKADSSVMELQRQYRDVILPAFADEGRSLSSLSPLEASRHLHDNSMTPSQRQAVLDKCVRLQQDLIVDAGEFAIAVGRAWPGG